MSESRDPAIKLFGKTIPVPTSDEVSSGDADRNGMKDLDDETTKEEGRGGREEKDLSNNRTQIEEKDQATQNSEDPTEPATCSEMNETPETPSVDKETISTKATEGEEEQGDMSVMNEKTLKKPDKILPCPRCSSLDTKFCYYNNYNANQPRHFCKNCQRYWTAGGTMRNVPVGAGRRKNKNTSHYRQMTVSEALQTARTNISESIRQVPLKPNDTVLNFGLDTPLCESMASVLNLAENTMRNCQRNGCHRKEQRFPIPCVGGENGEEHSSGSSITSSNTMEGNRSNLQEPTLRNCQSYPQVPCFPGAPWSYPWNPAQWSSPLPPQPSVLQPPPPPPFCASSFPISFFPATPYWGCSVPGTWSLPWPSPLSSPLSSPNTGSSGSNSNSPTLGKHSREGNINDPENEDRANQGKSEQCLWIPKTLRIDDPEEAAKSSIWATLGIKNDKADTIKGGGLFKAFQSKTDEKNHTIETSQVLHANPAALSRSINFHESS